MLAGTAQGRRQGSTERSSCWEPPPRRGPAYRRRGRSSRHRTPSAAGLLPHGRGWVWTAPGTGCGRRRARWRTDRRAPHIGRTPRRARPSSQRRPVAPGTRMRTGGVVSASDLLHGVMWPLTYTGAGTPGFGRRLAPWLPCRSTASAFVGPEQLEKPRSIVAPAPIPWRATTASASGRFRDRSREKAAKPLLRSPPG